MKLYIFLSVAITGILAISDEEQWVNFKNKHGKVYTNSREETLRHSIFLDNLHRIEEHNGKFDRGESLYRMGSNQFADMKKEEFLEMLNYQKRIKPSINAPIEYLALQAEDEVPDTIDWILNGAVTEIKNQELCGSCWSFSATGTVEGQIFKKTGKLVSLSEQNLVDCVTDCFGCGGGYMDKALDYIRENGIMSEDDYPYEASNGRCRFDAAKSITNISSCVYVEENNEMALQQAVATVGPISVAIDASGLQFYKEGVYSDVNFCGNSIFDLNHGVLIVGYGTSNGTDFWKVKNSWGISWGMDGYIMMSRNNNVCGIADLPLYPKL